jgi:CubicO group peptidase (beta-lactamase class C family)
LGYAYASGGAGCISTVDDYIKFLEALRTHKLLKKETLDLMVKDRLTEHQKRTYWSQLTHGYGLGVRCPNAHRGCDDFGWGGAASAYLAVDQENGISLYFGAHMLSSPVQGLRTKIYRFVRAELIEPTLFEDLQKELKALHNYNLTY